MLHNKSSVIDPETFRLIQELQTLPELSGFFLVGGTSLSLQLGHRNSIDIDLFTESSFDDGELINLIQKKYKSVSEIFRRKNTIICLINNIKTDFIRHEYPLLLPPITEEGISFLSKEDISAIKIHAIIQSGKRLKDFIDIYFLLQHFSMKQMIEFFSEKYKYTNPMIALKALNFFKDIDEAIDPPRLLKPLPLSEITKRIQTATKKPDRIFN